MEKIWPWLKPLSSRPRSMPEVYFCFFVKGILTTILAFITPPTRRAWWSYKFASLDFSFFGVRSWAAAHGWYRWLQVAWAHLNTAFNGGICQQNMYFDMYTTKSKPQEGSKCKDCHAKCFITTNSIAKLCQGRWIAVNFESVFPMRVSVIFRCVSI